MKLSQAQLDLIWKMQHGRRLVKYPIHCGDPSRFVLYTGDKYEFTDKRTVNSLLKRGLVEFAEDEIKPKAGLRRWAHGYRLTEAGRKVVAV